MRKVTVDEVTDVTEQIIQEMKANARGKEPVVIDYAEVARRVNEKFGKDWILDIPNCPRCNGIGEPMCLGSEKKYLCTKCGYEYDDEVRV